MIRASLLGFVLLSTVGPHLGSADCDALERERIDIRAKFKASNGPLWIELLPSALTIVARNSHEHAKPKLLIIGIHGMGTTVSNLFGLSGAQMMLGGAHAVEPGTIAHKIRALESYFEVVFESIALPGSKYGPPLEYFKTRRDFGLWLAEIIRLRKVYWGNPPVGLLTKSAGSFLATAVQEVAPEMVRGFAFMSPTKPGDQQVVAEAEQFLRELERRGTIEGGKPLRFDAEMFQWAKMMSLRTSWERTAFNGLPTIMLFGGVKADPEVSIRERTFSTNLAAATNNIGVFTYDHLGHNLLSTDGLSRAQQQQVLAAYNEIFLWGRTVVNQDALLNYRPTSPIVFNGATFH